MTGSSWYSYALFQNTRGDLKKAKQGCLKALEIRLNIPDTYKTEAIRYKDIGNTQLLLAKIFKQNGDLKKALEMAKTSKESYEINGDIKLIHYSQDFIEEIHSILN